MNHHYEVDWMFGWMGADSYCVLGNSRQVEVSQIFLNNSNLKI